MADVTIEQRLSGVAESIKRKIANAPKFRPTDPELAEAYDAEIAGLLDTLQEATAAAAVDEASILFAKDRSNARNARMLAEQKLRGDFDTAMLSLPSPFLTAASGSKL